jgi:FMN phosphatase YigB (HAD superfamily)
MNNQWIVLFDLEHTLYEAYQSWRRPLHHLFIKQIGYKNFPWDTYFTIRKHYRIFDLIFDKSFRHHWLTPEIVSLMILLMEKKINPVTLLIELEKIEFQIELIKNQFYRPGQFYVEAHKVFRSHRTFISAIEYINEKSKSDFISKIQKEYYNRVNIQPYEGVLDGLNQLFDRDIKVYLASEGDYDHQIFKVQELHLEKHFSEKILASEIYKSNYYYKKNWYLIKTAIENGSYSKRLFSEEIIKADETVRKYALMKRKENYYYYYSILNAIRLNNKKPEEVLLKSKNNDLINYKNLNQFHIIMVGDRLDKDVLPVWRIFGKQAFLIRVKVGKYKNETLQFRIPKSNYTECKDIKQAFKKINAQLSNVL